MNPRMTFCPAFSPFHPETATELGDGAKERHSLSYWTSSKLKLIPHTPDPTDNIFWIRRIGLTHSHESMNSHELDPGAALPSVPKNLSRKTTLSVAGAHETVVRGLIALQQLLCQF